jgi:hypothetical protein
MGTAERNFVSVFQKRFHDVTVVVVVTVPETNNFEFWLVLNENTQGDGYGADIEGRKREGAAPTSVRAGI